MEPLEEVIAEVDQADQSISSWVHSAAPVPSAPRGGSGNTYGGGGAGGRIALYYDANSFSGQTLASGGSGYTYGGPGTIYKKSSSKANGDLAYRFQ